MPFQSGHFYVTLGSQWIIAFYKMFLLFMTFKGRTSVGRLSISIQLSAEWISLHLLQLCSQSVLLLQFSYLNGDIVRIKLVAFSFIDQSFPDIQQSSRQKKMVVSTWPIVIWSDLCPAKYNILILTKLCFSCWALRWNNHLDTFLWDLIEGHLKRPQSCSQDLKKCFI